MDGYPRLVTDEEFLAVRLRRREQNTYAPCPSEIIPIRNKAVCALCGEKMTRDTKSHGRPRWRCKNPECGGSVYLDDSIILERVMQKLKVLAHSPEHICTSRIVQTARDAAGRPSEPLLWSWGFPALRSSGHWMISAGPVCCKRTHAGGKMGVLLPICIMWYDGGVQCWLRSIYWIIWLIKWDAEFFLIFGCSSKVNGCTGSLPRSL